MRSVSTFRRLRTFAALLVAFILGFLASSPIFSIRQVSSGVAVIRINHWTGSLALCVPDQEERYSCSVVYSESESAWLSLRAARSA